MLDSMISFLWPEGMMQYTVVGAEASATDPNDRPDLVDTPPAPASALGRRNQCLGRRVGRLPTRELLNPFDHPPAQMRMRVERQLLPLI